ncbi:hypothetical protein [Streptomyces sp. NPDC127108]
MTGRYARAGRGPRGFCGQQTRTVWIRGLRLDGIRQLDGIRRADGIRSA